MTTVRKGYVDTDEGQIHYRYAGQPGDDPPLVLLHQNTSSSDMFTEAMEAFDGNRYVVAPDTPGSGLSDDPEHVPAISYYARALTHALDVLGIGSFHVCGHHTGASIAAEMATADSDRIRSVSFSGPPYLTENERAEFRRSYNSADSVPPLDDEGEYLLYHWNNHAKMGGDADVELRHRQIVDALLARESIARTYGIIWEQDFVRHFEDITVPRMIMCATDDVLWDAFERARHEHPDVRATELDGGNYAPLRDAATFATALRSFVEK
jgi:pimeloyl-ACP methyl ester carboxylesterase